MLLYISPEAVIPSKAGIQIKNTGFPRVKHGAGLVKPGMTFKVKGLLMQYTIVCLPLLFFMVGCAVGPNFVRPKPPSVDRYTHGAEPTTTVPADGQVQRFEKGARIAGDWWRLFNSPKINTVLEEALTNNQTLQTAQASLRQSQQSLRAGYGVFFPQANAGFGATREKFSPASIGSTSPSILFNLFTLATTVNYTLDVFGGERRAVEGLRSQVDFQHYTALATYLTLTGNVVNTVIAEAAYRDQIKATEEMIRLLRDQVRITETQVKAGIVPYSNLLSILSQLATTEATLPPLQQNLSQAEHLLATLAGRVPAEWTAPEVDLGDIKLPGDLPISLPSDLVRQRPDILAAEAQLHGASANIGVATAALFPTVTLDGTFGFTNTSIKDLFKSASTYWNLAGDASTPLFHGGTLWFQRKAAIEGYQQFLASYRQTVLSAFAQVANTLRALEHDADALRIQSQALDSAKEALRLIQINYRAGLVNYLQVLIADSQYYQAKIGCLQALAQRLQDTVALFVALGGGWWNAEGKILGGS
jgi:NodT family efflux transporter outer membrane factor (OMF) lipoprotein